MFFSLRLYSPAKDISRAEAVNQVIQSVREFVGPVAAFKTAVIVPSLPKVCQSMSPLLYVSFVISLMCLLFA